MGTPDFAVPSLLALAGIADIAAVYTAPDKPAGRGRKLQESAVKTVALAQGWPVVQPRSLRTPVAADELRALSPDLVVVAAYGKILPAAILEIPPWGCINVHASYLPRHRGASPIHGAILAGDPETGVTIMLMDEGLDTGPILLQRLIPLPPDTTTGRLTPVLADLGAALLVDAIARWLQGSIVPLPQVDTLATLTRPVTKEDGRLDFTRPAAELERAVRAYDPWPSAWTTTPRGRLRILAAMTGPALPGQPGTLVEEHMEPAIVTGEGSLVLRQVQPEGRRPMDGRDWLNGQRDLLGTVLGAAELVSP